MSDLYDTIFIPSTKSCFVGEDSATLKKLEELASLLLPCFRENEATEDFIRRLNGIEKSGFKDFEEETKILEDSVKCKKCKNYSKLIYLENCHDGFCKDCIYSYLKNSTNRLMILEDYEGGNQKCSNCSSRLTENDLKAILDKEYNDKNIECQVRKITKNISEHSDFKCINCKTVHSAKLAPSDCNHMCKQCLARSLREKHRNCNICSKLMKDGINSVSDMIECEGCRIECYFIGDYMMEICPGCIFCQGCLSRIITNKICSKCERILSHSEILQIYHELYGICQDCGNEDLKVNIISKLCCRPKYVSYE